MGISSARPRDLEDFASRSRGADDELQSHERRLRSAYGDFQSGTAWGSLDMQSMLAGFGTFIDYNEIDARWVTRIAQAFRRAGGDGAIKTLPDAAIQRSLKAGGLLGGRRSVTFDNPVAYGMPTTSGYANDPVNTASGNFVEDETDLAFGGLLALLRFGRVYNSRSNEAGAFGNGWSSWADVRLRFVAEGVAYDGPDGQRAVFPRMGEGYGRVLGVAALVEPLPGGMALRWFSGERWEFDDAGLPVFVTRGPGSDVRLQHEAGRLVSLAHAGGARTRLDWDGERIGALVSTDGRRVSYRYDDGGNLVGAGDRTYDVDDDGRVVSVIDADGVAEVVNSYDEEGRVLAQVSPFGRQTLFGYLPGAVTVTADEQSGPDNVYIHDEHGRLQAVIDGEGARLAINYDEWGNPVAITDRKGAVTVNQWDDQARLLRQVEPAGGEFALTYDDRGRVVEVAERSTGAVTRMAYEGDERMPSAITDPEGGVSRMMVEDGLVRRIVDADGVELEFEFDADGNVVASTDGDANVTRIERGPSGLPTAAVSPLGRRTTFAYDEHGRVVERHDPGGAVWCYEYSAAGRPTAVVDPSGAREEIRYGDHGEQAAVVDPLGHVVQHGYDVLGNIVVSVAATGAAWAFSYDGVCRLRGIVDPSGATWRREYDEDGNLTAAVDPTGSRRSATVDQAGRVTGIDDGITSTSFEFDALGRMTATRLHDGTESRTDYDRCGRPTVVRDPSGGATRCEYTPAGRISRVVEPSGRVRSAYEYDACGRLAALVDGAGRRREYRYDADGAPVEIADQTGATERFTYDEAGRLTDWEAPGRGLTSYAYDAAGRIVAITDRDFGTRRFAYDAAGRLVAATDSGGATTRYAYDANGALTEVIDPLGGTVTRAYDDAGRPTSVTDQLGRTTTIAYDAAGRVVGRTDGSGARLTGSYDVVGRLRSYGPEDEEPVTIEYDDLGRLVRIDEPGSFSHRLRYDPAGRLVERRRGDLAMRWTYDCNGDRVALGYPDGSETRYTYDAAGVLAGLRHPAVGVVELERDPAGRLIGARGAGMRASWGYERGDLVTYELMTGDALRTARLTRDPIGRVVAALVDGVETRFSYDAAGQLVSAGDAAYEYDAAGRLVRECRGGGEVTFEHDAAGQLILRRPAVGRATAYEYDGAGRRVRETSGDCSRVLRWDALGRLTAIEAGERTTRVDVDALGELASVDGTPLMWDSADPLSPPTWIGDSAVIGPGTPWAAATGAEGTWLPANWQGTIGASRDPWGASSGKAPAGPQLGYRGELVFEGDVWLRNRIYEPGTRAFLAPDPLAPVLGTAVAANPYHYAANNPIGLLDPLGLRPLTDQELRAVRERMGRPPGWLGPLSSFWTGLGADVVSSTLYGVAPWMAAAYATRVTGYFRSGGMVSGHWRRTPSGGRVWIPPHYRAGTWVAGHLRGNPTTQAWGRAGRLAGPLGTIFSGVAGGADQYVEDADRRGLSTTDRVGRTGGAAVGSAGLSLAGGLGGAWAGGKGGAALGGAIGSVVPGVGTAVGGAVGGTVGTIGGAVVGSGAGSWVADQVSEGFATGGQAVANGAVDAWDSTEGARDAIGGALDSINPF